MLSNYKFSFMGNFQLQVVNENTRSISRLIREVDHASIGLDIPVSNNAALFIKFHSLIVFNGLKTIFSGFRGILWF